MACLDCFEACDIYNCYSNLYVGKVSDLNTEVTVIITHVGTGRAIYEAVTTDGTGVILLTAGTWQQLFYTQGTLRLQVMIGGEAQNISPFLTPSTFGSTTYNCIRFKTNPLYDSSGDMYAQPNQYLFEPA